MTKKIITILCTVTLLFSSAVKANSTYNNDEKVTKISNIPEKELYTMIGENAFWGSQIVERNKEDIVKIMGSTPYWRIGKQNNREYGIYKTDFIHYLIVTSCRGTFLDRWYVSKIPSKSLFEKYVKIGTNIKVVKLIDSDSTVETTIIGYTYTEHRFSDGSYMEINYIKNAKGDLVVNKIRRGREESPVVNNLLDIDYELIKNENPNEERNFLEKLKKLYAEQENGNYKQVIEKKPERIKVKYAKRINKKFIRIKFKRAKNAKKYQIQYAINKKFKKAKIETTKKTNCVIKVSRKKTYYIRVRGVNGKKKGRWSRIKKLSD